MQKSENTATAALGMTASNTVTTTFLLIFSGLVAIMLGGFFAVRGWVVAPVKGLQGVMGRLSGGDLQAKVTGTDRKDEIGGMARAVQVFTRPWPMRKKAGASSDHDQ
jgi:methyl-accepting chemotaxis protein